MWETRKGHAGCDIGNSDDIGIGLGKLLENFAGVLRQVSGEAGLQVEELGDLVSAAVFV